MRGSAGAWRLALVAALTVGATAGCAAGDGVGTASVGGAGTAGTLAPASPSPAPVTPSPAAPSPEPTYALCAEFPATGPLPGDGEGWWNGAPARPDGSVVRDPAEWPPQVREHPRVATVEVDTARVISLYDRTTCRQDRTGYVPPAPGPDWPPGGVVVLDADTGELLGARPASGGG
ncbi:hypothetical protein [Cellulomonas sp.]|uniref:hypothetical protein n=1 Tax=Cellulomonas sp. TaxID=40001 RepID=UPI002D41B0E8|nr:hypothetical protein [Cellulomonas sp.]HYQ75658.1 hypothetical protein [Cellulomonas sp.]